GRLAKIGTGYVARDERSTVRFLQCVPHLARELEPPRVGAKQNFRHPELQEGFAGGAVRARHVDIDGAPPLREVDQYLRGVRCTADSGEIARTLALDSGNFVRAEERERVRPVLRVDATGQVRVVIGIASDGVDRLE